MIVLIMNPEKISPFSDDIFYRYVIYYCSNSGQIGLDYKTGLGRLFLLISFCFHFYSFYKINN